jgi:4-alpha-glucanotransferase
MTRSPVSRPSVFYARTSGILLHPTSFPSRFGIGDFGPEARQFVQFLADSDQQTWQILPLSPTGFGNSPYMCYSALAGNPLLISPDRLREDGLLQDEDFWNLPWFNPDRVEYDRVAATKLPLLRKACDTFAAQATPEQKTQFEQFCTQKAEWLDDYALFMALKREQNGESWHRWEPQLANREPGALAQARDRLAADLFFEKFLQYVFYQQWSEIKAFANDRGIQIIGDIPIYVAHDSADVWANPENFCLDPETGEPALMAGVPPDYFSETGQLWGNPVYNWEHLQKTDFRWWIQRFRSMLDSVDQIRIDHFRGFEAYWAVKQGEETALNGEWIEAPGKEFFETLKQELGKLPILAEDLGVITPEVEALRDYFDFPGMKILQFAFGSDPTNPFLPFNYPRNCVVYTGTHDNDTTVGWYEKLSDYERENLLNYVGGVTGEGIHWELIRLALSTVANMAILPYQDVLGLGSDARMNFPSKGEGNWEWRYRSEAINDEMRDRLKHLTRAFGRAPLPKLTE